MRSALLVMGCGIALLAAPTGASAQVGIDERLAACAADRDRAGGMDRLNWCEARPFDYAHGDAVRIEHPRHQGSVEVEGTERSRVVAIVSARAPTEEEARDLARRVEISRAQDGFRVTGPPAEGWAVWSVRFVLEVPSSADVDLDVPNGPVSIRNVNGHVRVRSKSGVVEVAPGAG